MNPPRLGPDRQRFPVNSGISLKIAPDGFVMVVPNRPTLPTPVCRLPRLPAVLLERPARLMRRNAMDNRALVFALYLCVVTKRWSIWLPPQVVKPGFGSLADLTFITSPSRPRDEFRLAGSLVSADSRLWGNIPILMPEFDGIHLQFYASAWAALSASLVVQGKAIPAKANEVFMETYDGMDRKLQKNVRV